jgi:HEPN domain-containing protein
LARPETREVAEQLLRRANSDLRACRKLAEDDDMGDDVIGFHAQQAVEKAIKVALTLAGARFPRTHDVTFLVSLAERAGIVLPEDVAHADWLTPWAAGLRYDEPAATLDRGDAVRSAEAAMHWARGLVAEQP